MRFHGRLWGWACGVAVATAFVARASAGVIVADAVDDWIDAKSNSVLIPAPNSFPTYPSDTPRVTAAFDGPEQGHADSVGSGAWSYGRYTTAATPATFSLLNRYDETFDFWGMTGLLFKLPAQSLFNSPLAPGPTAGGAPGATSTNDSVRRWVSGVTGTVTVTGRLSKRLDDTGGNGFFGRIYVNGVLQYSQFIAGNDTTGINLNVALGVNAGDLVDFVINDNAGSANDNVLYSPTITLATTTLTSSTANGQTLSFGNVRVGAAGTQGLTVSNTGDTGTTLSGDFGAASGEFQRVGASPFGPLAPSSSEARNYTYMPSARGAATPQSLTITSDAFSNGTATITLAGTGVGPVASSDNANAMGTGAQAGTLNFGSVGNGGNQPLALTLYNISSDGLLPGNLADLSLFAGIPVSEFSVVGITLLEEVSSDGFLNPGESAQINLLFTGDGVAGVSNQTLTLDTDQGVAFSSSLGDTFTWNLQANELAGFANGPAPEPASLALLALIGLGLRRRVRR